MKRRHIEEAAIKGVMFLSMLLVAGSLGAILVTILVKGLPALSWEMVSQSPKGGFYLGKEGGILNAIVGSFYLALGATVLALLFALPIALYLQAYARNSAVPTSSAWQWMCSGASLPSSTAHSASSL